MAEMLIERLHATPRHEHAQLLSDGLLAISVAELAAQRSPKRHAEILDLAARTGDARILAFLSTPNAASALSSTLHRYTHRDIVHPVFSVIDTVGPPLYRYDCVCDAVCRSKAAVTGRGTPSARYFGVSIAHHALACDMPSFRSDAVVAILNDALRSFGPATVEAMRTVTTVVKRCTDSAFAARVVSLVTPKPLLPSPYYMDTYTTQCACELVRAVQRRKLDMPAPFVQFAVRAFEHGSPTELLQLARSIPAERSAMHLCALARYLSPPNTELAAAALQQLAEVDDDKAPWHEIARATRSLAALQAAGVAMTTAEQLRMLCVVFKRMISVEGTFRQWLCDTFLCRMMRPETVALAVDLLYCGLCIPSMSACMSSCVTQLGTVFDALSATDRPLVLNALAEASCDCTSSSSPLQ